jgi:hypothetical protein
MPDVHGMVSDDWPPPIPLDGIHDPAAGDRWPPVETRGDDVANPPLATSPIPSTPARTSSVTAILQGWVDKLDDESVIWLRAERGLDLKPTR